MKALANGRGTVSEPRLGDALEQVRRALAVARLLLLAPSPGNLQRSAALVDEAAAALDAIKPRPARSGPNSAALTQCRRDARRLAALAEQAWAFSAGSLGLAVGVFGYTRQGAGATSLAGDVSVEG